MTNNPPYDKWERAYFTPEQMDMLRALNAEPKEIWRNSRYQVLVHDRPSPPDSGNWPAMIWLSIKRRDKEPIHDWRDLQRIKNDLIGPEHEAMELYPAESRVVDTANQIHLWVLADPTIKFPVGFTHGIRHDGPSVFGEKQRPFEDSAN